MKKILDFKNYLTDKLLEDMNLKITELELILSPKLVKILKEMNHKIADELLELHLDDKPQFKVTFVDLGSEPDTVSFIQSNKVPELIEPDIVHGEYKREKDKEGNYKGGYFDYAPAYKNKWISDYEHLPDLFDTQFKSKEHPVWTKFRSEIKVGRFVTKIFGNKFPANKKRGEQDTSTKPDDVESFVNMYIATVESHSKVFKLVNGEDIRKWYSYRNYFKEGSGTLGGSCMKDPSRGIYFDIYCKNPDKVQLLILHPEDVRDKIMGRAIVWKLDDPQGRYFMDRIYTNNDSDEYMFIEYAKRHGWLYKSAQSYGWDYNIVDPTKDKSDKLGMSINLNVGTYDYFPYVDTLQFYNKKTGELTSDYRGKVDSNKRSWVRLTNTDGGTGSLS